MPQYIKENQAKVDNIVTSQLTHSPCWLNWTHTYALLGQDLPLLIHNTTNQHE